MYSLRCSANLAGKVAQAWRGPSLFLASRAVSSTSSCVPKPRVVFPRVSLQARVFSSSAAHYKPEMAWSHRPCPGCAGLAAWAKDFPAAGGKQQSPINLVNGEYNKELASKPLEISYKKANECVLVNTGHSIQVNFKPSVGGVTGGPVTDNFEIAQYHFHWASTDDKGSEHTVAGKSYPNELHLVHWNTSKFASVGDAISQPNGLTVLGIFLEAGEEHVELKKIIDRFDKVKYSNQEITVDDPICVDGLLPSDTKSFWSYDGSLTTPPCYESVNWVVFRKPISVSKEQLKAFRELNETAEGDDPANCRAMVDNYRPVCESNGRKLSTTFEE